MDVAPHRKNSYFVRWRPLTMGHQRIFTGITHHHLTFTSPTRLTFTITAKTVRVAFLRQHLLSSDKCYLIVEQDN